MFSRKKLFEIFAQNQPGIRRPNPHLRQQPRLLLEHLGIPAAREERRIRPKQQARRSHDSQCSLENGLQVESLVSYPGVAAGSVEVDVWTKVGEHQRLAE